MIVVTDFPIRNVNNNTALPSRWSSVNQPIIFSACRQDKNVVNVQFSGGAWRILVSGSLLAGTAVGQKCWLKSGANNRQVTITAISGSLITIAETGLSVSTNGYINFTTLRRNYYAEIGVYRADDNNQYEQIGTHEVKPMPDGTFTFDLHGYLLSQQDLSDHFTYTGINKKQPYAGTRYNFNFTEYWVGSANRASTMNGTTLFYWTRGIKQLQQVYNFNVGEHVPFPTIDTAKFLSGFAKPTYFPGFPFSLSFIWSDAVAPLQLQRIEDDFVGGLDIDNLDASQGLAVNQMLLAGGYPTTVKEIDVWLNENGGAVLNYVETGYVADYTANIPSIPEATEK